MSLPIKETPKKIRNMGEPHVECLVLLDTSGSMSPDAAQLKEGLQLLADGINSDDTARGRVELGIITFDDEARVAEGFGPMSRFEMPQMETGGMTAMHAAVKLGLQKIEERKTEYKKAGTAYYRPWMFLLTDGGANDNDSGEFEELKDAQKGRHVLFFPVGIGESVDYSLLKSLNIENVCLKADRENLTGCFRWLSDSMSVVSDSHPGDKVTLPAPTDYGLIQITT